MFGIGPTELVVVGVILFFLFGPRQLPKMAKGIGDAIREARKAAKEISREGPEDEPKQT
jgi:TatA/E family protein of Tat protein translocase